MMRIVETLKEAREARGLDLEGLAARTRLRLQHLQALELGRFEDLPRGVYARAVVRAYADAVGLDAAHVVGEVAALLPVAEDPIDGLARVRGIERPRKEPARESPPAPEAVSAAVQPPPAPVYRLDESVARSAAAAAVDAAVLAGVVMGAVVSAAAAAGVSTGALLAQSPLAVLPLAAALGVLYFVLLAGVGGWTPGLRAAGLAPAPRREAVTAHEALRRAGRIALREASITADLLVTVTQPAPEAGTHGGIRSGTPAEAPASTR